MKAYGRVSFVFRLRPKKPIVARWTKVGPCLDTFMLAGLCSMMRSLLMMATGSLKFSSGAVGPDNKVQADQTAAGEEGDYHAVAGRNFQRAKKFFDDPTSRVRISILALVIEPLRYLHIYFLRHSKTLLRYVGAPALCDLMQPARSIVYQTLQYFSTLLRGTCSRLILVWRIAGCTSLQEWVDRFPELAQTFRRSVMAAVASALRRHHVYLSLWPWKLCVPGEPRL